MRWVLAVGLVAAGCGGISKQEAEKQVDQLITLYTENRPKFVEQKQAIVQDSSCERAEKLKQVMDEKAAAAAMSPDNTDTITAVKMELDQAEKDCKAK